MQKQKNNGRYFDGIIFDLGSTLIYFEGEWPEVLKLAQSEMYKCLSSSGIELNEDKFATDFRTRLEAYYVERESEFIEYTTLYVLRNLLEEYGYTGISEQVLREALEALYRVTQQHWHVEEDAVSTLTALKSLEFRLGIISNAGDDADVQSLVDKAKIRPFFDLIISSAAEGIRKPNPRIFEVMLEHWDLPSHRIAMVGDTLGADILGAHNVGMYSIWITRRADTHFNQAHKDTIIPDATIFSLSELPDLLQNIKTQ